MIAVPNFALIGQPAHRSLSPAIFSWLFERMEVPGLYVAREVAPADLAAFIAEMRRGAWKGLSVTAPHKVAVRALIDEEDALARRIGAVNTLVAVDGRIVGYNTDAYGCRRALMQGGAEIESARVLVLGAGGAARAGVFAALEGGARVVEIANRTQARADELARDVDDARCATIPFALAELQRALDNADILLQCTSAGMGDAGVSALPDGVVLPAKLVVHDMVYRPIETALLRQARASGCRTVDGLWMLVHQALQQFRFWTGREAPDSMARALHQHLYEAAN